MIEVLVDTFRAAVRSRPASGVLHAKRIWGERPEEVGRANEPILVPMTMEEGRNGFGRDHARGQPEIGH